MNAATNGKTSSRVTTPLMQRLRAIDWMQVAGSLDADGSAVIERVLSARDCASLTSLYEQDMLFRSRVVMARHGYGRGEYKYFGYPLPPLVDGLRRLLYPHLATIANRWHESMRIDVRFPQTLDQFLARCHEAGQRRPTPLMLDYGPGDYNCLHQDLYGERVFPLQLTVLLSAPGRDFSGGEFIMTQQRPRMQSSVQVVPLQQGDAVIFAVHQRPLQGTRGIYRVNLRHGVSRVRAGRRRTLGIIFHDAR